jgi:2-dehydro-3-deoxyglucarate aldolase/4-hydroxy-2-oxoheptanedioate aldolase
MQDASLHTAAEQDEPLLGSWGLIPHPLVSELVAGLGYDFVSVDVEHSSVSYETLANMLRGADAAEGNTETLVRVPDDDPTTLQRTLDLGPDALLVPMVHTAEQAERIVDAVRYPPGGSRGIGPGRATTYGRSLAEYVEADDDGFATHVQLESERAIENAAEVAAVDGIDGVFVGPMDLSLALGSYGDWESDRFQEAVETALRAARDAGVAAGTFAASTADRERRLAWDIDYLVAGVDLSHLTEGATEALEHSQEILDGG